MYNKNETKGYPTPCFMQLHKCSYNRELLCLCAAVYILNDCDFTQIKLIP